jgi:hypothetical protein
MTLEPSTRRGVSTTRNGNPSSCERIEDTNRELSMQMLAFPEMNGCRDMSSGKMPASPCTEDEMPVRDTDGHEIFR